ncbi:MAG: Ig-like domain-containing protein, partial [Actinomycetota bacterium]|nr:Ig-like domain-containing protein [Actinomycetota bacterium]
MNSRAGGAPRLLEMGSGERRLLRMIAVAVASALMVAGGPLAGPAGAQVQPADVYIASITDSPDPVAPGGTLTYVTTVANSGPAKANNVTFSHTLPTGVTFNSMTVAPPGRGAPPSCSSTPCNLRSIDAGEQATVTVVVTVSSALSRGSTLSYAASVTTTDPESNESNNAGSTSTTVFSNVRPTCAARTLTTDEDVTSSVAPSCSDVDGDTLTYSIVSQGTKGTASVVAGQLSYNPALNQTGSDSFTYRAHDGTAYSDAATVTVTITAVNDPPVCSNTSITTNEDTAGQAAPVCSDIDSPVSSLTYSVNVASATKGTPSVTDGGELRYTPNPNATGSDSFTYTAQDASGATSVAATVGVTINGVNDPPTCAARTLTTDEDVTSSVAPSCSDVDGDTLTYSIVSQGTKGT